MMKFRCNLCTGERLYTVMAIDVTEGLRVLTDHLRIEHDMTDDQVAEIQDITINIRAGRT
jgi:predicted small metal-binding protein